MVYEVPVSALRIRNCLCTEVGFQSLTVTGVLDAGILENPAPSEAEFLRHEFQLKSDCPSDGKFSIQPLPSEVSGASRQ